MTKATLLERVSGRRWAFENKDQKSFDAALLAEVETEITTLRQRSDKLEAALRELIPSNISLFNPNMPDETILPCDIALGSFRRANAALDEPHA